MDQIEGIYKLRWLSIMSYIRLGKISATFNLRLGHQGGFDPAEIRKFLINQVYMGKRNAFKITMSPGLLLYQPKLQKPGAGVGYVWYFWPSFQNFSYFGKPRLIANYANMLSFISDVDNADLLNFCLTARSNTSTKLLFVTQLEFRTWELLGHPLGNSKIGCGVRIPAHIKNKKSIVALTHNSRGKLHTDNLCLFRCLAMSCVYETKMCNLDAKASLLYRQYYGSEARVRGYEGVEMKDLHLIERYFKVDINVFSIEIHESITGDLIERAYIIRESTSVQGRTLNINLFKKHFSLIKDLSGYSKSFMCKKCKKAFTTAWNLKSHTQSIGNCQGVKHKFPGGVYKNKPSIFELLECCGIHIPMNTPKFYPYLICFDLESFLSKKNLPGDTQCVGYENHHEICSCGIISNVPGFLKGRVFIANRDCSSDDVGIRSLRYMIKISNKADRYE